MTKLNELNLSQARDGLLEKKFSAQELVGSYIAAMQENKLLNVYVLETTDQALEQAKIADMNISKGTVRPMEGIPIGIKDLFCTKGIRTTACSKILQNFIPPYESTVSQNLKNAGSIMLGKLNMDEFAMGSSNITSMFGPCVNPWRRLNDESTDLTPGGSSGGSSAGVAAFMAAGATASDTGGSIRQPASFCGVVGMKPTYGLCSRRGMVAYASSLDQAGPITRTVRDSAIMLQHMAGYDPLDATSLNVNIPNFEAGLTKNIKGLKIGIPKECLNNLRPTTQKSLDDTILWLTERGAIISYVSLPTIPKALAVYYVIAPAEASSNLARYDGVRFGHRAQGIQLLDDLYQTTRREGFGDEVRRRILIGTYVLSAGFYDAYYNKAQRVRTIIAKEFESTFQNVDVLLTPTTPSSAFGIKESPSDPLEMYLNDVFTVPVNLAGLPAISVPVALDEQGLPLSVQFIGPKLSEQQLFNVADVVEDYASFETLINLRKKGF